MNFNYSVTLILLSVFLIKATSRVPTSGKMMVLSSPKSLQWYSDITLPEGLLNEILSAALGLTVKEASWDGLRVTNPFEMPKALLVVIIEGLPAHLLNNPEEETFPHFHLSVERASGQHDGLFTTPIHTANLLQNRLRRLPGSSKIISIFIEDKTSRQSEIKSDMSRTLSGKYPYYNHERFDRELELICDLRKKIESGIMKSSAIIHCRSLHAMIDALGPRNSTVLLAAKEFWHEALELTKASAQLHRGSSLSLLITHVLPHAIFGQNSPFNDIMIFKKPGRSARDIRTMNSPSDYDYESYDYSQKKSKEQNARKETSYNADEQPKNTPEERAKDEMETDEQPKDTSEERAKDDETDTKFDTGSETDIPLEQVGRQRPDDDDTAAIFNIVLWLGTGLCFALLSIVHVFMAMDPGRDSVVYRMTEPRKKAVYSDNI